MKNDNKKITNVLSKVRNYKVQTIGLPLTPATITDIYQSEGFEITASWGGGMGGSCEKFNTLDNITDEMLNNEYITIHCLDGKTITLFTKFIVKITPIKIVVTVGTHNNPHFIHNGNRFVCTYKFYENERYMVVNNEYSSSFKKELTREFYQE